MGVGPVAGTKVYIGTSEAIASPDDYIEIGDIKNLGDISAQFTPITVESIGSGDSFDIKGTRKYPNIDLMLNKNDTDVGQIALKAASAAARGTLYNFKITEPNTATAVWTGEVFGYGPSYGGVNDIITVKTSISVRPASLVITPGT